MKRPGELGLDPGCGHPLELPSVFAEVALVRRVDPSVATRRDRVMVFCMRPVRVHR